MAMIFVCTALGPKQAARLRIRQIFVSIFTVDGHELFLSTDFEKPAGAFEVCDRNGRHLGEWLFSGIQNGAPDTSGSHDIEV